MADTLQLRGGTTSQNNSFTGSDREVTVDTTKKTLIVHDGSVAGGFPLMKETGNSSNIEAVIGGAVTLKHNTSTKLATESNGIRVTGNIFANDNQGLLLGTNGTFRINYNGSNCQVTDEGTGDLLLGASKIKLMTANLSTATGIDCNPAGTTSINHAGSNVFKTISGGVHINGNLGVGLTNPPQKLTVSGNAAVVNSAGIQIVQLNRESDKGVIKINDDAGVTRVQFKTDGDSYIRGGNLGIGTESPQYNLDVADNDSTGIVGLNLRNTNSTNNANTRIRFQGTRATDSSTFHLGELNFINTDSTNRASNCTLSTHSGGSTTVKFTIDSSGNIGAPSGSNIYNASDSRLKKNVVDIDKGLSAVKSLRPVSFNWIDGFCDAEKDTLYGFIAQEVQSIDSNLIQDFSQEITVDGTKIENVLRVNEKFIIPMLVKAIQELSAKVEALEAK